MVQAKNQPNINKEFIIKEIKRTAGENGGIPLGRVRFFQQTGIKESDWSGKIWVRWSDAVCEAGFEPNQLQITYDDQYLIEKFIGLIRDLGHYPVSSEIKMRANTEEGFPALNTFYRLGTKPELCKKIVDFCGIHAGHEDVNAVCKNVLETLNERRQPEGGIEPSNLNDSTHEGYVYLALLQLGKEKIYKIGKAILVERRKDQISIQLPSDLVLMHTISTDDAFGIEFYWHKRFAAKNTKGEWFKLTRQDVEAFRKRKFM